MLPLTNNKAELFHQIPVLLGIIAAGIAIGAILLRCSIGVIKILADSVDEQQAVPQPSFGKAIKITLFGTIVIMISGSTIGLLIFIAASSIDATESNAFLVTQLFIYPISFIIMVVVLKIMLPTSIGRAIKVLIFQYLLVLFLAAALCAVMLPVYLLFDQFL